jgi:hypothetical protein
MRKHIGRIIADYLEDRSSDRQRAEAEYHLERCRGCAADVAWARAFRGQFRALAVHPTPRRVIELASVEGAPESDEERAHLSRCPDCRREIEWARAIGSCESVAGLRHPHR